jgi:hypothetical protein
MAAKFFVYLYNINHPTMMRQPLFIAALLLFAATANSQVLISLVFGDVLNTDKVEFGLSGGMNRSNIYSISEAEAMNNFDLGFYFHVLLKNSSYISTGVHVKSNVGATGMTPYPIGNHSVDSINESGTLTRKIPGFTCPSCSTNVSTIEGMWRPGHNWDSSISRAIFLMPLLWVATCNTNVKCKMMTNA